MNRERNLPTCKAGERDKARKKQFSTQKIGKVEYDAVSQQEGPAFVCNKCGKKRKQEHMKGRCRGFAWLNTGMTIAVKEKR